jgi:aerobic-type carbon monoxide dehydrogenase small subunit (CoxS/CutS family)
VLRDTLGLTGTKFGCGMALCGACTVHLDGSPSRSCQVPSARRRPAGDHHRGLSTDRSHPVQKAWIELDVPQCGYCQSGQIMSAAALLASKPRPATPTSTRHVRQHLPLRHLPAHSRRHPPRRGDQAGSLIADA